MAVPSGDFVPIFNNEWPTDDDSRYAGTRRMYSPKHPKALPVLYSWAQRLADGLTQGKHSVVQGTFSQLSHNPSLQSPT